MQRDAIWIFGDLLQSHSHLLISNVSRARRFARKLRLLCNVKFVFLHLFTFIFYKRRSLRSLNFRYEEDSFSRRIPERIKEIMQTVIETSDQTYTPRWVTTYCRGDNFGTLNFRQLSTTLASYRTPSRRNDRTNEVFAVCVPVGYLKMLLYRALGVQLPRTT